MDNLTIGRNIAKFRKLKDIKAFDMAERLGLKEATYTKYERGKPQ
ncbi:MAG: helix-turn-helix transcriptional regulator [Bacteroidetes bacterium]|nr:helix-turn-helix transcriptional regulator [Bacteroidota bacterium]